MRRAVAPLFITLVVTIVAFGAASKPARRHRVLVVADKQLVRDLALPAGYWVWSRLEHGDEVSEVPPADLVAREGASGWPGCPDGYLCTRRGIRTLAIGASGGFHYAANVFTSSDFQHHGSIAGRDVRLTERYSCAHPGWVHALHEGARLLWERDRSELRVAVDPSVEGGGWPFSSSVTGAWWVFREVSSGAYYERLLLRRCQPTPRHECVPGCFSRRLVLK